MLMIDFFFKILFKVNKMRNFIKLKFFTTLLFMTTAVLFAQTSDVRWAIKANGTVNYIDKPQDVSSLKQMFQDGKFYGRLRNNNFYFWYDAPEKTTHLISGVGGSFVFQSAAYNGVDFTVGLYGSRAFFDATKDPINVIKSGKDTLSRFKYANTGSKTLATFAQANLRYKISNTDITAGRQLVETFYTKSNDTKMIPNSFDGVVLTSGDIPKSFMTVGYLAKEKLRDHENSHAVFMVGDANSTSSKFPVWSEQDDSAMHRGLTYTALKKAGKPTDAPLIVADIVNSSIADLKLHAAGYVVPELLSQVMTEADYKVKMGGFVLVPGIRYIHQFDNGAGKVGGANYLVPHKTEGYKDPYSLDSDMIAARVVLKKEKYNFNLAYTQVLDKADLITPWRGFPTAGYTRSMGVYNWRANDRSYRLQLTYGANKSGIYKDGFWQTSVLYIQGDDKVLNYDRMVYYFGYIKNLVSYPEFQYRFRIAYKDFKQSLILASGKKQSLDYVDSRLEFNYLF